MKSIRKIIFSLIIITILFGNVCLYATTLTDITPIVSFEGNSAGEGELSQEDLDNLTLLSADYSYNSIDSSDGIIIKDDSTSDMESIMNEIKNNTELSEDEKAIAEESLKSDNYNDDFFAITEENVTIDQYVDGNVYIIADEVTINNNISGNLFIIANKITHNASIISGSVYEIAEEIYFTDTIQESEANDSEENTENTENTEIQRYNGGIVTGSVYALAQEVFNSSGHVSFYKDINVLSSKFEFNSEIYRKIKVRADDITIGDNAFISNNAENYLGYTNSANDNSNKYKDYLFQTEKIEERIDTVKDFYSPLKAKIVKYIMCLMTIIFIIYVSSTYGLKYHPEGKSFVNKAGAVGIISFISLPLISIIFIISVIGMPIGIIGLLLWIVAAFILAKPALASYLAKLILKDDNVPFVKHVLVGIAVYICMDLLTLIPGFGAVISVICSALGCGIVLSAILDKRQKNKKNKNNEEEKKEIIEETKAEETLQENEINNEIKETDN